MKPPFLLSAKPSIDVELTGVQVVERGDGTIALHFDAKPLQDGTVLRPVMALQRAELDALAKSLAVKAKSPPGSTARN